MLYPNFKDMLMRGEVNLLKDDIYCFLSNSYFNGTAKRIEDVSKDSSIQKLNGKSINSGVFDASGVSFGLINEDVVINSVILFTADGFLIACIVNINGFPIKTTTGSLSIRWNTNRNKIMSI